MICTNDRKVHEIAKMMMASHGMLRESGNEIFERKMKKNIKHFHRNLYFYIQL